MVEKITETNYAVKVVRKQKHTKIHYCNLMKCYHEREDIISVRQKTAQEIPTIPCERTLNVQELFEKMGGANKLDPNQDSGLKVIIQSFRLFSWRYLGEQPWL